MCQNEREQENLIEDRSTPILELPRIKLKGNMCLHYLLYMFSVKQVPTEMISVCVAIMLNCSRIDKK